MLSNFRRMLSLNRSIFILSGWGGRAALGVERVRLLDKDLQFLPGAGEIRADRSFVVLQQPRYFVQAVAIHDVHHKHRPVGGTQLLHQRQNLLGSHLVHHVVGEGHLLTRIQSRVLIESAVFSVVADGGVDQNRPQPRFERQRIVVFVEVLKRLQKPFVQHVFGLLPAGRVAKADAFCVAEKLLEQGSLRPWIVDPAGPDDARKVSVAEGGRFLRNKIQSGLWVRPWSDYTTLN